MSIEDSIRCITAFQLILNGENVYYKDRLNDPNFVGMVKNALHEEKKALERLLAKQRILL